MAGIYINRAKRSRQIRRSQAPVTPGREPATLTLTNMSTVRNDRVEGARQLIDGKGYDLDSSFKKAMHKLLVQEFGA